MTTSIQATGPDARRGRSRVGFAARLTRTGKKVAAAVLGEDRFLKAKLVGWLWLNNWKNKPLLMVHTMGKVGSTTVVTSLIARGFRDTMNLQQPHFLSEEGMAFVERLSIEGVGGWEKLTTNNRRYLLNSHILNKELKKKRAAGERVKVITIVREPVATNLSGFFHNHVWWPAAVKSRCDKPLAECIAALQNQFLERYPHDVPATWFDMEIRPLYGVDVFATPFDCERGFSIYHSDFADVMVLKLEKLEQCAAVAFHDFLGLDDFQLVESNKAEDKSYAELYKAFRRQTTLSESYLDRMYASRMARHFYTEEEIAAFRRRWTAE
jgi:hypothetical protein